MSASETYGAAARAGSRAGLRAWIGRFDWRIPLALAATYLFFGSGAAGTKAAIHTLPPLAMMASRSVIAGSVLLAWGLKSGAKLPGKRQFASAALVGILMVALGSGAGAVGQRTVPSGIAGVLSALVPLLAACIGYALYREKLERRALIGLLIGFAGVGLLLRPGSNLDPLGLALLACGNLSWALGAVLAPRLGLPEDPRVAAGSELLGGGTVLLVVAAAMGAFNELDLLAVEPASWAGFGWLVIVGVGGFTAYGYLARTVSCSVATTFSYVNPVVAISLGYLLFSEPVSLRMAVAVAVIIAGVCLIVSTRTQTPCNPVHPFTSGAGHIYIVRGRGRPLLLVDVPSNAAPERPT